MWNRNLSRIVVLKKVSPTLGNSRGVVPLNYESLRFNHSRFHRHLKYNVLPRKDKDRPMLIDPKDVPDGEPMTPSIILGDMSKAREFKFDAESMNARGFLRYQKPYDPPEDASDKITQLCKSCLNASEDGGALMSKSLGDSKQKFDLLTKAFGEFQHAVPNSMLHMMNTVGDLVTYYCTPIRTLTPYDELIRNTNLPPNLHVQKEPIRFHPDTDTRFGGVSAYTKSSTIVTGLRTKKKYRGYEAKMTWP